MGWRGSELRAWRGRSEAECAVRAEAHQIEVSSVGLAVDQHQVGTEMTVPVILPLPAERVVAVPRRQWPVRRQLGHDMGKFGIERPGEAALPLPPVIPFEGA